MTKRLPLFLGAAVIGLTIAAWDRSRASEAVLTGTVAEVITEDGEGPDRWFIKVSLPDTEQTLGPLQSRPVIKAGDPICVIQSVASHRDTTYRRASTSTVC